MEQTLKLKTQNSKDVSIGWDSRQPFVELLVYKLAEVLQADYRNPDEWLEALSDYYDLCSPMLAKQYKDELKEVEILLNARTIKGQLLNDKERSKRKQEAYNKLRDLFRQIHKEVYNTGIYIPFKTEYDEIEEFRKQFK